MSFNKIVAVLVGVFVILFDVIFTISMNVWYYWGR